MIWTGFEKFEKTKPYGVPAITKSMLDKFSFMWLSSKAFTVDRSPRRG